jgi:hypothetical protein
VKLLKGETSHEISLVSRKNVDLTPLLSPCGFYYHHPRPSFLIQPIHQEYNLCGGQLIERGMLMAVSDSKTEYFNSPNNSVGYHRVSLKTE